MEQEYFLKEEKTEDIQVIESEGTKKVLINGQPYMEWKVEDGMSQRMAIVQLYNSGLRTKEGLSELFGIHINTVQNYIDDFARDGAVGLIEEQKGPKQRWKITPSVKAEILRTLLLERITTYAEIQEKLKGKGYRISIESIRQVLIENGFVKERIEIDGNTQGDFFTYLEKDDDDQLKLSLTWDKTNVKTNEAKGIKAVEGLDLQFIESKEKNRSYYSPAQRIYLDQLEQGIYNSYAGGLLFVPLMRQYNFLPTIRNVINIETYEGYSLDELCLTLFYFDLFRFESMENFKTVYPEEFGMLIGRSSSPSLYTLRRFLHKVKELSKSEEVIDEFGKEYLRRDVAKWGVLYIDGHFLPYYGIYCISMGWHGVRKIPMKGSYNFIAIDEKFNPLLFLVRSSSEDLVQKIPEIILKAKKLGREAGVNEDDIKNLIVIFDREGYSAELFRILDGRDKDNGKFKTRFISWAKYTDKWMDAIEDEKIDKIVTVSYEMQDAEEVKYFETERTMKKYGKIRTIVIESGRDKKRAAIYTNDREMGADIIIQLICRRWGEENLIKELMMKHLIDYSPGYETEELEEQPVVENLKLKELKQKRAEFKSELSQIKSRFGHDVLEEMAKGTNWDEIKKKHLLTIADMESINSKITLLNLEMDKHPEKVKFDEAHGKKLLKLNYERKRFLDCIKVFAYNMEKQMCRLLLNYYNVKKEVHPALFMIIKRGGLIKLEEGKLSIKLRSFKNPEIDSAARRLCEDLNQMKPSTLDKFNLPIYYSVV